MKGQDARTIGQRLGATHVLEGTVRREGSRVRVSAQLVCTADELQLWNKDYNEEVRGVFAVQDAMTAAIVGELRLTMTGVPVGSSGSARAESPEVRDLYWRARYSAAQATEQPLRRAIDLYERALALDSTFAPAYAGIATAWEWLADAFVAPVEALPRVRDAARRALALDSLLAEAEVANAYVLAGHFDFAGAERSLRRALALDSTSIEVSTIVPNVACSFPRLQPLGLAVAERAMVLDRYSPVPSYERVFCLYVMRRYDEAIGEGRRMAANDSTFFYVEPFDGAALREKGNLDSALVVYRRAQALSPDRPLFGLAVTLARMGRRAEARAMVQRLEVLARRRYVSPGMIAAVHIALGDRDAAFAALDRSVEVRDGWLWPMDSWPELDPVRSDPRFQALRRRVFGSFDTGAGNAK